MRIGGYSMELHGNGWAVTVKHYESGWSFFLQDDDASQFLNEWENYQDKVGSNFRDFLSANEYDTLFQ